MDRIHHHSDHSRSPRPGTDAGAPLERQASRNLLRLEEGTLYVVLGTGQWATPSGSLHVAHVVQGTGSQAWQVCATDRLAAAHAALDAGDTKYTAVPGTAALRAAAALQSGWRVWHSLFSGRCRA